MGIGTVQCEGCKGLEISAKTINFILRNRIWNYQTWHVKVVDDAIRSGTVISEAVQARIVAFWY